MKFTKYVGVSALIAATLTFTGCTENQEKLAIAGVAVAGTAAVLSHSDGSHTDNYYHHGHDYGQNRNYSYRAGVRDGCDSSRRRWSKDEYRFRHDNNYNDCWRSGYRRCRQ